MALVRRKASILMSREFLPERCTSSPASCRQTFFPTIFAGRLYPPNTLLIVDRLVKEEFLIEVEATARGRDV
jgi:hypothetical protein